MMKKIWLLIMLLLVWSEIDVAFEKRAEASTSPWLTKAPMPMPRGDFGVAVVNGHIYAIGGRTGKEVFVAYPVSSNQMYDPATDTWTTQASMPTPRFNFAIAVFGDKIYVFGGQRAYNMTGDGKPILCPSTEVYDPAANAWQTKKPMPIPEADIGANVVEGLIYIIGGAPGNATIRASNLNQVYDPATDCWTQKEPIPRSIGAQGYGSAVVNNRIHIIGGGSGLGNKSNQIYTPSTDTWTKGAPIPFPGLVSAAAATSGTKAPKRIYALGGGGVSGSSLNQVYDVENDSWSTGSPMPTARNGLCLAVVDDTLYAIGGEYWNGDEVFTDINEQYTPWNDSALPTNTPEASELPSNTPIAPEFLAITIIVLTVMLATVGLYFFKTKKAQNKIKKVRKS